MGKTIRQLCYAVVVLAVGLVWLYLPSFAFSKSMPPRPPATVAGRGVVTRGRQARASPLSTTRHGSPPGSRLGIRHTLDGTPRQVARQRRIGWVGRQGSSHVVDLAAPGQSQGQVEQQTESVCPTPSAIPRIS